MINYTDLMCRCQPVISKTFCPAAGEVCSSRVRAGPAEEDPVVRVPPEEAGRGALGSPAVPRRQGRGGSHHLSTSVFIRIFKLVIILLQQWVNCVSLCFYCKTFVTSVLSLLFKCRMDARSMNVSICSANQQTPQRTLNWSKLQSKCQQMRSE